MIRSENDTSMRPLISVVMATYNGEKFIEEAIQSVLDQTFKDFEFIIVDDGSIDATATIISSFKDDRIVYFKKDNNTGIADSLNIGIAKAKGIYIARMDDDDVCMLERFEKQLEVFEINKNIILCGTNVLDKNSRTLKAPEQHIDILMKLIFVNPIYHPTVLIKRDLLLTHKYNPKKVPAEDHDLWSRLIFEGQFYQLQEPLLYCRRHETSVTANRRIEQLQHNISISKFVYDKIGFNHLKNHDENIEIFASHDYSITGRQLKNLTNWFQELKLENERIGKFSVQKFNDLVNVNLEWFIISFFTNNKLMKKVFPFLYLNFAIKMSILRYYFNKYF